MKKSLLVVMISCLVLSLGIVGCGPKKAASSKEAIDMSQSMQTVEQKSNYLIDQAKAFYNSKDFEQAINIAQYVLSSVDQNSEAAKDLITKAKDAIVAKAKEAAGDMQKSLMGK